MKTLVLFTLIIFAGLKGTAQIQYYKIDSVAWRLADDPANKNGKEVIVGLSKKGFDYRDVRLILRYQLPGHTKFKIDTLALTAKNSKLKAGNFYAIALKNLPATATSVIGIRLLYVLDVSGLTQIEILRQTGSKDR